MKRILLLIAAMASLQLVHAQTAPKQAPKDQQEAPKKDKKKKDGDEHRTLKKEWEGLGLNDEQKSKLAGINKSYHDGVSAVEKNAALDDNAKKKQIKQLKDTRKQQVDAVLTPEQRTKLAQEKGDKKEEKKDKKTKP
ncbi:hypothetical protein LX64_04307 [Chitinophaga skermanii]|uniref:LTXXQ motif family protein n=1 Tax=Chitinophaga skermanii TaxID=331697 RepID=A0A327Q703_9BACT|nr:hypothetical protein [Chitinophaga skermanii]RAI99754.1 hypothetical protein LX64_04307 [Chitinophaga skermanii]